MGMYLHFTRQTKFVSRVMAENIKLLHASVVGEDVDNEAPRALEGVSGASGCRALLNQSGTRAACENHARWGVPLTAAGGPGRGQRGALHELL